MLLYVARSDSPHNVVHFVSNLWTRTFPTITLYPGITSSNHIWVQICWEVCLKETALNRLFLGNAKLCICCCSDCLKTSTLEVVSLVANLDICQSSKLSLPLIKAHSQTHWDQLRAIIISQSPALTPSKWGMSMGLILFASNGNLLSVTVPAECERYMQLSLLCRICLH